MSQIWDKKLQLDHTSYKISELKGIEDTKPNNFLVFEKPTLKQEFQLQIVQRLWSTTQKV